jgi:DNA/RNA-binding domain of Phe-tRNA-synthetase-like protein
MIETNVQSQIFIEHATYRRGLVLAERVKNDSSDLELLEMLESAVTEAQRSPTSLDTDPRITAWQGVHRGFSNPKKFPPSHEALLRRVQKGRQPGFINNVVAIMTICSISEVVPIGADDLRTAGRRVELRKAGGTERFVPLDRPETIEICQPGEVIYYAHDPEDVCCRKWNWRNSARTRIGLSTTTVLFNIDAVGDHSDVRAVTVRERVAEMLVRYCDARVKTALLTPNQPSVRIATE